MGAVIGEQTDLAIAVSESDQLFAEQENAYGIGIGRRHFRRHQRRDPVLAHEVAHRRTGSDSGDQLVFFLLQHLFNSPTLWRPWPMRLPKTRMKLLRVKAPVTRWRPPLRKVSYYLYESALVPPRHASGVRRRARDPLPAVHP